MQWRFPTVPNSVSGAAREAAGRYGADDALARLHRLMYQRGGDERVSRALAGDVELEAHKPNGYVYLRARLWRRDAPATR